MITRLFIAILTCVTALHPAARANDDEGGSTHQNDTPALVDRSREQGVLVVRHGVRPQREETDTEAAPADDAADAAAAPRIIEVPRDHPLTLGVLEAIRKLADPDPRDYEPASFEPYEPRPVRQQLEPPGRVQRGGPPRWEYTPVPHEYTPRRDFEYERSTYRTIWRSRLTWRLAALVTTFGPPEVATRWAPLLPPTRTGF